jgi:hypothetical protein
MTPKHPIGAPMTLGNMRKRSSPRALALNPAARDRQV